MKIYLASSWRNNLQPEVLRYLRAVGHEVYDFRNPGPNDKGFAWSDIDPEWQKWSPEKYREALKSGPACTGFGNDWNAMVRSDVGVLLLPCGRSAHLEAGYFVGAGKNLVILVLGENEPELMYLMADRICLDVPELLEALRTIEAARVR